MLWVSLILFLFSEVSLLVECTEDLPIGQLDVFNTLLHKARPRKNGIAIALNSGLSVNTGAGSSLSLTVVTCECCYLGS